MAIAGRLVGEEGEGGVGGICWGKQKWGPVAGLGNLQAIPCWPHTPTWVNVELQKILFSAMKNCAPSKLLLEGFLLLAATRFQFHQLMLG